jgi:hypothetical protein
VCPLRHRPARHILLRCLWCACVGILSSMVVPLSCWAVMRQNTDVFLAAVLVGGVALLPIVLLTLNLAAFPWDYSVFGLRRRVPLPSTGRDVRDLRGGIVVGRHFRMTWPGVGYLFIPEGLGIDIELIGTALVPAEQIVRITRRGSGRLLIHHNCPEIRAPLLVFCPELPTIEPLLPEWFAQKLQSA